MIPKEDPILFKMTTNLTGGIVKKGKTIEIELRLTLHCTTELKTNVTVAVKGKGFCSIEVKAESRLSTKLNSRDIEFGEILGTGGFGTVYRGKWRGADVAIKSYHEGVVMNDLMRAEIDREVELCASLRSQFIVTFFGRALQPGKYFLVMEFVPLGSLGSHVKRIDPPLDPRFKIRIMTDVSRGMDFLHQNRLCFFFFFFFFFKISNLKKSTDIIHRDLKTDNVLVVSLDPTAQVCGKLSDFNTSRVIGTDSMRTKTKGVGTPIFMAPECLESKPYDEKVDVYS